MSSSDSSDAEARALALSRARALEEACDFEGAARAALEGDDAAFAARLAALARAEDAFVLAEEALASAGTAALDRAGEDLAARGQSFYAARLLERAGSFLGAAEAYARAGHAEQAAMAFERGGKPADGARVIERALRDDPRADHLRRALAELLLRHGRTEPAVRVLQAMHAGEERDRALPLLARSLRAMGLIEAAAQVDREIDADAAPPPSEPARSRPRVAERAAETLLFGRYEVVREVKKTPHAHLFETLDRIGAKRVAVKILAASTRGTGRDAFVRFEREARALQRLRHPTIVGLLDFLPDGPAMVLEWMSGGSLADLMVRETFAPARAVEIVSAVLTALGQAHRVGVLHRDVKPSNVLFDDIGAPKLADFGAAHLGDLSTTVTGGAIGTFSYMAPEQRMGRPASVQSDLYAVGALLYEMLTGEPAEPIEGGAGFVERPPSAYHGDLTEAHDAIVARFLGESSSSRPADAFEARKLLESVAWSTRVLPREGPASRRSSNRPPANPEVRLAPAIDPGDGRDVERLFFDTITERHVIVLPLDARSRERFLGWAKVFHPSIAAVVRASTADAQLWLEAPRGRCLADTKETLPPRILGELRHALTALHRAGGAHGSVDREHVYLDGDGVWLAPPRNWTEPGDAVDDLRRLALL